MLKELSDFVKPDFKVAKRVIAVGDVHGQFNLLRDLVENQMLILNETSRYFLREFYQMQGPV